MILPRPRAAFCAGLIACVLLLGACTAGGSSGSGPSGSATTDGGFSAAGSASTSASAPVVAPLAQGKVTERAASSCPLLTKSFVQDTVGMRLARITVLRNKVRTVGCRFYALQNPNAQCDATCLRNEHLPGPEQPAVEIVAQRYPSAVAAHNAFVRIADKGSNPQQQKLTSSITAVCFQTEFDPQDNNQDWACGFSKATTSVLVRVAQTSPALNTLLVTKKALGAL